MKPIKVGFFGFGPRGGSYVDQFLMNDAEIVAICEEREDWLEKARKKFGDGAAYYTNPEDLLAHEMDAVFLANNFHEHAPWAVRFLEKGVHVLSECTAASTMAECVSLARAAEKSDAIYMLAENYPYMIFNQEMKRVCDSGTLGKFLFAEGEYNHPVSAQDKQFTLDYKGYPTHWRNFLPRSYYITHSLAPIMHMTGAMPRRVCGFAAFDPVKDPNAATGSYVGDRAAVIMTHNDDGSVFRVTGCAAFGAHGNSYRVCGDKGQIENLRGMGNKVMLRYNHWEIPEGREEVNCYDAEWAPELKALVEKAGHGGSDFMVAREFLSCIREGRKPDFDVYFATAMSAVAILSHRSVLANGAVYDVPDFRKEEERAPYENDTLTPFPDRDGKADVPCCSVPDFKPLDSQLQAYYEMIGWKE